MNSILRRRALMGIGGKSGENKELLYSYTCQEPILVPVSINIDSLVTIEIEPNVDNISSKQVIIVPKQGVTNGLPKRAFNVTSVDSTHVQTNDTYAITSAVIANNFTLPIRYNFESATNIGSNYMSEVADYEIEIIGAHIPVDKQCCSFSAGGFQGVPIKTTNQESSFTPSYTYSCQYSKAIVNVDLANKTIIVKSTEIRGIRLKNDGTFIEGNYYFDDETTKTFTANTNNFRITASLGGGTILNLYKKL